MSSNKVRLGDLIEVLTDYHANGAYKKLKENVELLDDEDYALMVRTTNFENNDFNDSVKYINEHAYNFLEKSKVYPNDLIMNKIANAGSIYLMPDLQRPVSLAMNLFLIRINEKLANPVYVYLYLKINEQYVKQFANGSVTKTITKEAVRNLEIFIPSRAEQDAIVQQYIALDNKIKLNLKINQTLESIAQALFKSWFVDFDPVRAKIAAKQEGKDAELAAMCIVSGKSEAELQQIPEEDFAELQATAALFPDEFVESELGEVPKEWEVKPLDKIANYLNGLALQKFRPENEYDFLPIVKIAQLKSGVATIEEKASPNIDRKFIIENGDVIFSWSGSLMVDIWCGGKAALNQHLFKVTSNDYHKWLYYFYTKHHLAEFQRIAQAKAVTMGHIKREHLSQALCCIASNQLLEISNIFIGHFLQKLIELRLENNNLKQLRDTLLPKLLSGEVEVENL